VVLCPLSLSLSLSFSLFLSQTDLFHHIRPSTSDFLQWYTLGAETLSMKALAPLIAKSATCASTYLHMDITQ
jgi:hypothetical protein